MAVIAHGDSGCMVPQLKVMCVHGDGGGYVGMWVVMVGLGNMGCLRSNAV